MYDPLAGFILVIAILLVAVGLVTIIARRRLGENMKAAGGLPTSGISPEVYAIGLGVLQMALGVLGIIGSLVVTEQRVFSRVYEALVEVIKRIGLNVPVVGLALLLVGVGFASIGFFCIRAAWRSRNNWVQDQGFPAKVSRAPRGLVLGIVFGAISLPQIGASVTLLFGHYMQ